MAKTVERAIFGLAAAIALLPACTHDVVLPSQQNPAVCGDGVVEAGEECDVSSPGCVSCAVVPGYTCTAAGCDTVCGDGVLGDGPSCLNPRKPEACDMTGYWVARETDFRRDRVVGNIQTTSSWYLYRFAQTGTAFQVDESLFCGNHTTGTATVDLTPASLRALLTSNDPTPAGKHGPRRGTFQPSGSGCAMTFDRFYTIRGGTQELLPTDFATHPPLAALPKLPFETDPVHPTGQNLTYAEDTDGNGIPGFALDVSGIVNGVRDMAQREYKEYASPAGSPLPANAVDLTVPGDFDAEESVLGVSQCGDACSLIASAADPARNVTPRLVLRFIGKTLGSSRVSLVVKARPRDAVDTDLDTCALVRLALPHDPAQQ